MVTPEPHEIARILTSIPVRTVGDIGWNAYAQRFVELCRVFDITAMVTPDGGITYEDLTADDAELHMALEILLGRRIHPPVAAW